ncbi:hypothetical protein ACFY04_04275 [Streptomyces sp. NPDC001549]|uniref:hypothetical protein n=1 Tax=Streptomyces sp. NPDC001549 TaxID=3364586 RepID=UPI003689EDDC
MLYAVAAASAGLDSVTWEQLAGHPVAGLGRLAPAYWAEALVPRRTPNGRLIKRGPTARTIQEVLALVTAVRRPPSAVRRSRHRKRLLAEHHGSGGGHPAAPGPGPVPVAKETV